MNSTVPVPQMTLPETPLDLQRLIKSLPADVNRKLSLHDLKRLCDSYNTGPCPNCYGGHFRPCQWCGDSGVVTIAPKGAHSSKAVEQPLAEDSGSTPDAKSNRLSDVRWVNAARRAEEAPSPDLSGNDNQPAPLDKPNE